MDIYQGEIKRKHFENFGHGPNECLFQDFPRSQECIIFGLIDRVFKMPNYTIGGRSFVRLGLWRLIHVNLPMALIHVYGDNTRESAYGDNTRGEFLYGDNTRVFESMGFYTGGTVRNWVVDFRGPILTP